MLLNTQGRFDYDLGSYNASDPLVPAYTSVSPLALWELTIPEASNPGVDVTGVTAVTLKFEGTARALAAGAALQCPKGSCAVVV